MKSYGRKECGIWKKMDTAGVEEVFGLE